eukprot:scaffold138414_cov31-Tisochrysis_lutea.AAC.1
MVALAAAVPLTASPLGLRRLRSRLPSPSASSRRTHLCRSSAAFRSRHSKGKFLCTHCRVGHNPVVGCKPRLSSICSRSLRSSTS